MWQVLHSELEPLGLTIVTVALDTEIEAARPFHDAAAPTHPALVDPSLQLVDRFGITNVPFGLWIDEQGTIVRPAELAHPPRPRAEPGSSLPQQVIPPMPPERQRVVDAIRWQARDTERYVEAMRDWVAHGDASPYALRPEEVIERSRPRPYAAARAAAENELGQHLYRSGHPRAAVTHFQEAHRLDPTNWSYFRNAAAIAQRVDLDDMYATDLVAEVDRVGVETFYPELTI